MTRGRRRVRRRLGRLAYSIKQLARATSLGRSHLYAEIAAGRLVASKIGRRTAITKKNAMAWLNALPTTMEAPTQGTP
jgi:excisionase family DNA binding protein